jgi:hypothetical protein
VPLTQTALRKILSFDRRNLRSMLAIRKRSEETWVEYRHRQNSYLRRFMNTAGIMELVARLVGKQHGWAGHMVRLPQHHVAHSWGHTGTLEDWHLKQTIYSHFDPCNKSSWRHPRKGHQAHWESNLASCFGDLWRAKASDRKAWRSSRTHYIVERLNTLLGANAKPLGLKRTSEVNLTGGGEIDAAPALNCDFVNSTPGSVLTENGGNATDADGFDSVCLTRAGTTSTSPPLADNAAFGRIFVERRIAEAALEHFKLGLQVLFVGDSDILIKALLGDAATKEPELRRPLKLAHAGLRTLVQSYGIRSPSGYDLAKQVPRGDNSAADAAANRALDHGTFMEVMLAETVCFLCTLQEADPRSIGILFSFDGAARGNPGKASYGVCGWWGHFKGGIFEPSGLLVKRGCRLGTNTNNVAEAHGLASAVKVCLQYYGWVIQQSSELAQHIMREE